MAMATTIVSSGMVPANRALAADGVENNDDTTSPPGLTEAEKERIRQRLLERRQLMQASKSTNSRQDYLDLSRQRAALYNTTYRGVTCSPNIPCL